MGNKILAAVAIIFVGLAFTFVAAIVFVSRGKSAFWVDKKLKVGGLFLTLTSILSGTTGCGCGVFQPTCYDTAKRADDLQVLCYDVAYEPYRFSLDSVSNEVELSICGNKLGEDSDFFYVVRQDSVEFAKGALKINGLGMYKILTGKKAAPGTYELVIYEGALSGEDSHCVVGIPFAVKMEDEK